MNRKQKTILALAIGLGVIAIGLSAVWQLLWGSDLSHLSHWPHVPPPELFVTSQPKSAEVAGVYELTQQTITTNGLAALEGRLCQLDLRPDGSFTVTNYPILPMASSTGLVASKFISTAGRWRCDKVNIMYDGHRCWGVVFTDTEIPLDELALRKQGAPYDLMLIYGDGDEGTVMTFGKKR